MSDLIYRQDAIDALGERPWVWTDSDYEIAQRNQYDADKLAIETVPSAESRQGKWIPVSERLPKQGQEVICQCRANIIKVLKLDANGDWYEDAKHCYMGGFVVAWMPKPKPYLEENK